jgi:L-2,4-diaminobutyrate decarboxylase
LVHPETGVVVWRPLDETTDKFHKRLPAGLASTTKIAGVSWLRCVAANPLVDIDGVIAAVRAAL